jgi:heterotetrameric sarcosine oxidase gamma subunit
MADMTTFLSAAARPGRHGAVAGDAAPVLQIRERPLGALVQLALWGQRDGLADLFGVVSLDQPIAPGQVARSANGVRFYQLAPDRVCLNADNEAAVRELISQLDASRFSELDLASSRVAIEVAGPAVEDLMARLVTIDCAAEMFGPGRFALTALHEIAVLVEREQADAFVIWVPVTWADSLWHYICTAVGPFGYEVVVADGA